MKTSILLVLSLFATLALRAQTTVGLRAGFGQSSLHSGSTFDAVTDRTGRVGAISLGAFVELPLSELFSLRPGLEYTQRGTSVGLTEDVSLFGVRLPLGARAKTTFDYVDAPLLLQYHLPTSSNLQAYVLAGPSVGYALSGKLRTSARALIDFTLTSTDIDLEAISYERVHVAAIGGAGVRGRIGDTTVFLEGRYEYGLSQPYNVPLVRDGVGFQGWNVGAGVSFAL